MSKTERADAAFFLAGECSFLQGGTKNGVQNLGFSIGKFVVKCVVNVVKKRRFLCPANCAFLVFIFGSPPSPLRAELGRRGEVHGDGCLHGLRSAVQHIGLVGPLTHGG